MHGVGGACLSIAPPLVVYLLTLFYCMSFAQGDREGHKRRVTNLLQADSLFVSLFQTVL